MVDIVAHHSVVFWSQKTLGLGTPSQLFDWRATQFCSYGIHWSLKQAFYCTLASKKSGVYCFSFFCPFIHLRQIFSSYLSQELLRTSIWFLVCSLMQLLTPLQTYLLFTNLIYFINIISQYRKWIQALG